MKTHASFNVIHVLEFALSMMLYGGSFSFAQAESITAAPQKPPAAATPARREMVYIRAGEFLMGAPDGVGIVNEHPRHKVYLDAYFLDVHEVTVASYRRYCAEAGKKMPELPHGTEEFFPITHVTWQQADAYCRHIGKRLPTEAEWEKAARGGVNEKMARRQRPENPGPVRVVSGQFLVLSARGVPEEAQRLRLVRHFRQCVGMVL